MARKVSQETLRRRVVHGWAFRDWDKETQLKIREYLKTGNPELLKGTGYENLHEVIMKDAK